MSPEPGQAQNTVIAPQYGILSAGSGSLQAINLTAPSTATQVGPSIMTLATGPQRTFLQLRFNANVLASSIVNGLGNGTDGVLLQTETGSNVRLALDAAGTIDATNVFPAPNVAPPLVRLYINDPVLFPTAPQRLPAGQYKLLIVPANLRGASNQPFCPIVGENGGCVQTPSVSYSFNVGPDAVLPTPAPSGASIPVVNSQIDSNQEIRLFFNEAIDFQSIIGRNNATTRDRFMSRTFPLNNVAMGATTAGENIVFGYVPPPGTGFGTNYGFVVYMPDPFHNPTEVRIRVVDRTNLSFTDSAATPQNYGIDATVYESANLFAPTNSAATPQKLRLPPILPLPTSTAAGSASVQITLLSANSAAPTPNDTSLNVDGILGVTDRSRNALAANIVIGYQLRIGNPVANNPSPPDAHFVASGSMMNCVSTGKMTTTSTPAGPLTGQMNVPPIGLNDVQQLGQILDVEFGNFVNFNSPGNRLHNPPRRLTIPPAPTDNNGDPAIPFPQGGQSERGLWPLICPAPPPPPAPPLGVFLYVVDGTHEEVRVFESNTYTLLTTLQGVPKPGGLGADPNFLSLYVSNIDQGTVQRVNTNPFQPTFHQVLNTITVGAQPRSISVQPGGEDVFVVNSGDNTVSIIDTAVQSERTRLTVGSGPRDVFVTQRFSCQGCTFAYMAFVTNFFDNTVSVYESDSPLPTVNNGPQGKIIDTLSGFQGPSFGSWNRSSTIQQTFGMGVFIANSSGNSIEDRGATNFGLSPQPGFQGPPGFRTFSTQHNYTTNTIATGPVDATIDNLTSLDIANPPKINAKTEFAGNAVLLATYPGSGQVAAYDYATGTLLGTVAVPATTIYSYFDQ